LLLFMASGHVTEARGLQKLGHVLEGGSAMTFGFPA